jgi:hypothetical protein
LAISSTASGRTITRRIIAGTEEIRNLSFAQRQELVRREDFGETHEVRVRDSARYFNVSVCPRAAPYIRRLFPQAAGIWAFAG